MVDPWWQNVANIAQIFVAVFAALTFGGLVWYTIETRKMRVTAQQQFEIASKQFKAGYRPVVVLTFEPRPEGQRMILHLKLHNVGTGPAFGVQVKSIQYESTHNKVMVHIDFPVVALLQQSEPRALEIGRFVDGQKSVAGQKDAYLYDLITNGLLGESIEMLVYYQDISSTEFQSRIAITRVTGGKHTCVLDEVVTIV
jgi:hypothetical protein